MAVAGLAYGYCFDELAKIISKYQPKGITTIWDFKLVVIGNLFISLAM